MIRVIGPRDRRDPNAVNTTSRAGHWTSGLSPFLLGPVRLYSGLTSRTMENGWQFAKVYAAHADERGDPTPAYHAWARAGWSNARAVRYPMGKGARPLYSLWEGERLGYVEARKRIYVPLYRDAVKGTEAFRRLRELYERDGRVTLWDFDGYDYHQAGTTLGGALLDPRRIFGHAFILACMLTYGPDFTVEQVLADAG